MRPTRQLNSENSVVRPRYVRLLVIAAISIPLLFWTVLELYPINFMFLNGLKSEAQFVHDPFGWPVPFTLRNIGFIWRGGTIGAPIGRYFLNSVLVTSFSVVVISIISLLGAWSLSRYNYPGKKMVQAIILAAMSVPVHATFIPTFLMMGRFGLRNHYIGIVSVYAAFWCPLSIMVMRATFQNFPKEILEAALIDGCTESRSFWKIVVPTSMGPVASLAIVNSVGIWSELLYSFVLMNLPKSRTLTVGLMALNGEYVTEWTQIFAALIIATAPVIIIYLVFQRQIVKGMMVGAIK